MHLRPGSWETHNLVVVGSSPTRPTTSNPRDQRLSRPLRPASDFGPHEISPNFPPHLGSDGSDARGCEHREELSIKDLAAR